MVEIGKFNQLKIIEELPRGYQLDGGEMGEILLPKQYFTKEMGLGKEVNVFIYRDSEDRLVGTTLTPHALVGDFAYLNVVDESPVGAFLDWGLPKDLLVPFSEQPHKLEKRPQSFSTCLFGPISAFSRQCQIGQLFTRRR